MSVSAGVLQKDPEKVMSMPSLCVSEPVAQERQEEEQQEEEVVRATDVAELMSTTEPVASVAPDMEAVPGPGSKPEFAAAGARPAVTGRVSLPRRGFGSRVEGQFVGWTPGGLDATGADPAKLDAEIQRVSLILEPALV